MKLAIVKAIAYGLGLIFILSICLFAYAFVQKMRDDQWSFFPKQKANPSISSHSILNNNDITTHLNWQNECLNDPPVIQIISDSLMMIQSKSCHFIDLISVDGTWKHRIILNGETYE